jgi:hypothetical protein
MGCLKSPLGALSVSAGGGDGTPEEVEEEEEVGVLFVWTPASKL